MGFGLLGFLLVLPGAVAVGVLSVASGVAALAAVGLIAVWVWIAAVVVVMATLRAILQTALYLYAVGEPPADFSRQPLAEAFTLKQPPTAAGRGSPRLHLIERAAGRLRRNWHHQARQIQRQRHLHVGGAVGIAEREHSRRDDSHSLVAVC